MWPGARLLSVVGMVGKPTIRVYVDGQNLFRRALKGTPYLWLDVVRLCQEVLPRYGVVQVKYFTALVRTSPHDLQAGARQRVYLDALSESPLLDIHLGFFRRDVVRMAVHPWSVDAEGLPITSRVKRTIEKGSDVNLATHLIWDALHGEADAYAVLSNDSDLATPIRMLRDRKDLDVGVVSPSVDVAAQLHSAAAWQRSIRPGALRRCQLPEVVSLTSGRVASKPREW